MSSRHDAPRSGPPHALPRERPPGNPAGRFAGPAGKVRRAAAAAAAALLAAGPTAAGALEIPPAPPCAAPMSPARMTYRLIDGGRERGTARAQLTFEGGDRWRYEVETEGRVGILTVTANESSVFRWVNGAPRPLRYERIISAGPFRRTSTATFDWAAGIATGEHRGDAWERPLRPGMLDRLSVQLASARLIEAGAEALSLTYLDRGLERELAPEALPRETIVLTDGQQFETIRVDRVRGSRATRTWHAPVLGLLPARMEHVDGDDDERYFLELASFAWLPCPGPIDPARDAP